MGNNSYIRIEEDSKDSKDARKPAVGGTNIQGLELYIITRRQVIVIISLQ